MRIYSGDTSFNWYNALVLAESSQLVYENKKTVESFLRKAWGFDSVTQINADNTEVFIARRNNDIIISFRGTKGKADWIRNLKVRSVNSGTFGHIHRGFSEAYDAVKSDIRDAIQMAGTSRVFLTGHSLGVSDVSAHGTDLGLG